MSQFHGPRNVFEKKSPAARIQEPQSEFEIRKTEHMSSIECCNVSDGGVMPFILLLDPQKVGYHIMYLYLQCCKTTNYEQ